MCLSMYAGQAVIGSASVTVEQAQIAIILHDPPAPPPAGTQRTQDEHARMTEWQIEGAIALVHAWRSTSPARSDAIWVRMLTGMLCEVEGVSEEVVAAKWHSYCQTQGTPAQGTPPPSNAPDAAGAAGTANAAGAAREGGEDSATREDAVPDTPTDGEVEPTRRGRRRGGERRGDRGPQAAPSGAASGADPGTGEEGEEGTGDGAATDAQVGRG